jgi:hypothetical protein
MTAEVPAVELPAVAQLVETDIDAIEGASSGLPIDSNG